MYKKYAHKKVVTGSKPKVAKAVKKYVKRIMDNDREDKYFDLSQVIASSTSATNNAGSVVNMTSVLQGITFAGRIGEVINAKSLEVRFDTTSCYQSSNVGGIPTLGTNLRVIIFQDHQIKSSTVPAVSDILETVVYNSPINHISLNARRLHILMDKIFELDPNVLDTFTGAYAIYTTQTSQMMHKKFKPSQKITFTNATTGSDLNNIYILYISDQATNSPSVNCYSRLIFEDA